MRSDSEVAEVGSVKHRQFVTYLGLLCILIATPALSDAARIKCWTNNEGVRECGNAVPPEYAQKGHKEVSKSGSLFLGAVAWSSIATKSAAVKLSATCQSSSSRFQPIIRIAAPKGAIHRSITSP